MKNGFINVSLVSPKVEVGNPEFNINEILNTLKGLKSDVALFPELSITGYSCQDLFLTEDLLIDNNKALNKFLKENTFKGLVVLGGIFSYDYSLFNVAYVIKENKLLGIIPKYYLPNYLEFSESRWFKSGLLTKTIKEVKFNDEVVPFGSIIFKCTNSKYNLGIGIEICEDVWAPISPSNIMSLNGANVFLNLSASNDYLFKDKRREAMVNEASRKNRGAYLYVSANSSESTTGIVFSSCIIASIFGEELLNDKELTFDTKIKTQAIDLAYIDNIRKKDSPFKESLDEFNKEFKIVEFTLEETEEVMGVNPEPFRILNNDLTVINRTFELVSHGIVKRLNHLKTDKMILGVSGGLDSTIALLFLVEASKLLNKNPKDTIIPVFLPYENSSSRTKTNASILCKELGLNPLTIDITTQVNELLKSIDHNNKDVTYENAQVRVRTTILMELSNKYNGIMIGTSDLSEIAMGYSTYNGDSMSMYSINTSLSKTFIQSFIEIYANSLDNLKLKECLLDIVSTPISAELNKNQLTENEIGKYLYIDFILFRFLKRGDSKDRIKSLMIDTFKLTSSKAEELVDNFFNRFYKQQYKRNASPDSLKVTSSSLDSKLDFRMVSDVKR